MPKPDHDAALALQRCRGLGGVEAVVRVVLEQVHVVQQGAGHRAPRAASKRLTRSQMRPCRSPPRRPSRPLASSDQTFSGARRACRRWLDSPASSGRPRRRRCRCRGFRRGPNDVAGAGPVLLPALQQLALQQEGRVRAVVDDGEPSDLGGAGEFGERRRRRGCRC